MIYHQLKVPKRQDHSSIWVSKQSVLKNVYKNSDDILINDNSKIRKMELDFDNYLNIKIIESKTILNHFELTQINHTDINSFQVPMQTGFFHDKSGSAPIKFFGDTCNNFNNDHSFQLTKISLSTYLREYLNQQKLLKWREMENLNIEERQNSQNEIMASKVVSVVLSILTTIYKCEDCKCPVLLDEGFSICTNCSAVTIEVYCMKDGNMNFSVIDQNLLISLELLQSIAKRSMAFVKSLSIKTLTFEYNPNDMVVAVITESGKQ